MKLLVPAQFLIIALLFVGLSSCAGRFEIEKRHYRNGFYVHQHHKNGNTFVADTVAEKIAVENHSSITQENDSAVSAIKEKPADKIRAAVVNVKTVYKEQKTAIAKIKAENSPAEKNKTDDPAGTRDAKISLIFGIMALITVAIGLGILFISPFGIVSLLIGCFCASFGMSFGRRAMEVVYKKKKGKEDDGTIESNRRGAKRGYILSLISILLIMAYVLFRVGIVVAEAGSVIGVALLLLLLLVMLFIIYRLGFFRGLKS